jgi:hypothetical protein
MAQAIASPIHLRAHVTERARDPLQIRAQGRARFRARNVWPLPARIIASARAYIESART